MRLEAELGNSILGTANHPEAEELALVEILLLLLRAVRVVILPTALLCGSI